MTSRPLALLLGALGVGTVLSFAAFVWPTPYEYSVVSYPDMHPLYSRTNRLTGRRATRWSEKEPWRYPEEEPGVHLDRGQL